jgi:hypothetical protein
VKEPGDLKQPGDGSSELGVGEDISKETCSVIQTRQAIKFFDSSVSPNFHLQTAGRWELGVRSWGKTQKPGVSILSSEGSEWLTIDITKGTYNVWMIIFERRNNQSQGSAHFLLAQIKARCPT